MTCAGTLPRSAGSANLGRVRTARQYRESGPCARVVRQDHPPPRHAFSDAVVRVLFLVILGFIGIGIMVVAGIGFLIVGMPGTASSMRYMGFLYILITVFYLIFRLPLLRFATTAGRLSPHATFDGVAAALEHQRTFWRRLGIVMIASIILTIITIPIMAIFGMKSLKYGP